MAKYILLPRRGIRATEPRALNVLIGLRNATFLQKPVRSDDERLSRFDLSVLDSIHEDGPKLVELPENQVGEFHLAESELRLEPLRTYRLATSLSSVPTITPAAAIGPDLSVRVVCAVTRAPIEGAKITAFTSFAAGLGDEATTDATGTARLRLGGTVVALEKVYVAPPLSGYWGFFRAALNLMDADTIAIEPIADMATSVLPYFYGPSPPVVHPGIRVGIVDAGVGPHPDLTLAGGRNVMPGELPSQYEDNGLGHGTHVAGIIAANGPDFRGVAPGVSLYSYRAFEAGQSTTNNFMLLKALIYACDDGCDIINFSLVGESRPDTTLDEAFKAALRQGVVVVIAAGNDFRRPLGYPAAYVDHTGLVVSALGRDTCFPPDACETAVPVGSDPHDFVAPFTNVGAARNSGARIALIAPGVGVVSTVPGGYGVMSGTSMAAPAVTGMLARLLYQDLNSADPILYHAKNSSRVIDSLRLIDGWARGLGFGSDFEGSGIPY